MWLAHDTGPVCDGCRTSEWCFVWHPPFVEWGHSSSMYACRLANRDVCRQQSVLSLWRQYYFMWTSLLGMVFTHFPVNFKWIVLMSTCLFVLG